MAAWSGRRWSSKQYILTALLGTLVAIAAAAAISISLAPGHVSFSVTHAETDREWVDENTGLYNLFYNFTVVGKLNASRRCTAVRYGSLTAEIWYSRTSWMLAEHVNMTAEMPGWWRDYAFVSVWADWGQYNNLNPTTVPNQMTNKDDDQYVTDVYDVRWPYYLVRLEAKVRFRFGLVPTTLYTIRATCFPVNFEDGYNYTVQCTS